jgi:hypothetical protein
VFAATSKWSDLREKDVERTRLAAESGDVAVYRALLASNCLPLPGIERPSAKLAFDGALSSWDYALWALAGRKMQSHLGWVRRRLDERLLFQKRKRLFEDGGWIRKIQRNKKTWKHIALGRLKNSDISFAQERPGDDFFPQAAYSKSRWFRALQGYESMMARQAAGLRFQSARQPRLRSRTIKGWAKVRAKWLKMIEKEAESTPNDLLQAFDVMRERKTDDFGSRDVFKWLAERDQWWLWDGINRGDENDCGREDRDCVAAIAWYNDNFSDPPRAVTFTRSHATQHPIWAEFGAGDSDVEYWVERRSFTVPGGKPASRLFVVFRQLLRRNPTGTGYLVQDNVAVPLRTYRDFERSFPVLEKANVTVTPSQEIDFFDDLLDGNRLSGSKLGGLKVIWNRAALPKSVPDEAPQAKISVALSCDVKPSEEQAKGLARRLAEQICFVANTKEPRDGFRNLLCVADAIRRTDGAKSGKLLRPGDRVWPADAVENGFTITGNDQGTRRGLVGVNCQLTYSPTPGRSFQQRVGVCGGRDVFVEYVRTAPVALPGDDQPLPQTEQELRDRVYLARRRLNLQNAVLKAARLLQEDTFVQRKFGDRKSRERRNIGARMPCGGKVHYETKALGEKEIRENVEKAGELLLRWAGTDGSTATEAMTQSLKAIGFEGTLWDWLVDAKNGGVDLRGLLPKTVVPTKREAKKRGEDYEAKKKQRADEESVFYEKVFSDRHKIAKALCDSDVAKNGRRASCGLWAKLDDALEKEISYAHGDKSLLRLIRRPPRPKHSEIIDEHHLPLGRTIRGGLSIRRLSFLEDVRSFVRKWSCRPRFPGDVRRLSRKQEFAVADGKHIEHLREHRAKLLGHSAAAIALGFEQDLTRGIWLYRNPQCDGELWQYPEAKDDDRRFFERLENGALRRVNPPPGLSEEDKRRPHRAFAASHVMVFEDLGRYKFQQDRPKSENSRLNKWSHRRILKFAQHVGGLFSMPIALQKADFSSRFCSRCGAPGFRCSLFDPVWLSQDWMKRRLASNDPRDRSIKHAADRIRNGAAQPPWVLLEGGTHFVCANDSCDCHKHPINADENAAANVGLWFLRGREDFRARITGSGRVESTLEFVDGERFQEQGTYWKLASREDEAKSKKGRQSAKSAGEDADEEEPDDDETGMGITLYRDPSGQALWNDRWYEASSFWGRIATKAAKGIDAANVEQFAVDVEDESEELETQSGAS